MKIPVGIVGYGNLGKAVEKQLKDSEDFDLVAIFSKRDLPNVESVDNIEKYAGKIELMFLCGGSQNELEQQADKLISNFSLADCYDNHHRIPDYERYMHQQAQIHNKIVLSSFGWDPGLFSFMRALISSLDFKPYTFWGKGLSQGHTQAIKNIDGVIDAVQFTVPNQQILENIEDGRYYLDEDEKQFHKRLCFVVAKEKDRAEIKQKIVTMPDYFLGYDTMVEFVSQKELEKIKTFAHRGKVLCPGGEMSFSVAMRSNPDFTAKILTTFARAYEKLKQNNQFGLYNILDLPLNTIIKGDELRFI